MVAFLLAVGASGCARQATDGAGTHPADLDAAPGAVHVVQPCNQQDSFLPVAHFAVANGTKWLEVRASMNSTSLGPYAEYHSPGIYGGPGLVAITGGLSPIHQFGRDPADYYFQFNSTVGVARGNELVTGGWVRIVDNPMPGTWSIITGCNGVNVEIDTMIVAHGTPRQKV